MRRGAMLVGLLVCLSTSSQGQTAIGGPLPAWPSRTLDGRSVTIPQDLDGGIQVLLVGF